MFHLGRTGRNGVVKRQGAVQQTACDLPAVGHLAQRSGIQCGGNSGVDRFHRRQNSHLGRVDAQHLTKVDGVLDDADLLGQRGLNVERSVGDDQRFVVQRHVEPEHMRHAPPRAQGWLGQHRVNQFIGVQAALHDHFHIALGRHVCPQFGSRMAMRHIVELGTAQVNAGLLRYFFNARTRPDQYRHDEAIAGRIHGSAERAIVTRVHHRTACRLDTGTLRKQGLEAGFGIKQLDLRRVDFLQTHFFGRGQHLCRAVQHHLATLVAHLAVHLHVFFRIVL